MKTWNNRNKDDYKNRGEWDNEPDKAHWIDEATGLDCLINRGNSGVLCGYVGVPESHPFFGKDYDHTDIGCDVHGGLTFADGCHESGDEGKGICHPKQGAANETVWWLGFDCAHLGDFCPKFDSLNEEFSTYKNFAYVKREVEGLAKQLAM